MSRENTKLQKDYNDMVASNKKLQVDIQAMHDTRIVEDIAINKLGMSKPENYQMVYIDLGKENRADVIAKNSAKMEKKGIVAMIGQSFYNVLEYFN